jgi:YidC/Oxa1 family membrane protein insertase
VAGLFQFVQTQMMRPANQPKSTDPQQAMMNSVMNIMPLTVVFFGWSFAAGPVLYWATQSVYSVVQQWFITGWGNFIKWAPFLPELPEHRRLGYRPPRDLDAVVVVSGDGQPVFAPGPMGWLQRKMEEAQKQALERSGGTPATGDKATSGDGKADAIEADAVPVARASGTGSSRTRSRNGKRKGSGKGSASTAATGAARTQGRDNGAAVSAPAGAVIVPRRAKPVSQENRGK